MHGLLRRSLLAVLLLCLGSSCGPSPEPDAQPPSNVRIINFQEGEIISGSRLLQASAEDDSGRVARMEFRIDRTLLCTDSTTRGSGASFGCTWNASTTPGGDYQLVATAYDAAGNATTSEPVSFTIPPNQEPTIIAPVTATPDTLNEGSSTALAVEASDPDGDVLTYSWTQTPPTPAGTFSNSTGASSSWTAPPLTEDMTFTLQVTVSDAKGGQAQSSKDVFVKNLPENRKPAIALVTATPDILGEGASTTLAVEASDPDGDALTYSWTQTSPDTPKGKFSDSTAASPTWTAPALTSDQIFTLQVTVSDGRGGTDQRSVEVSVANINHSPVVDAITAPATVIAGNTASLSITASDPDGDPLTYAWTTIPSDAGLFVSGETTSASKWRSRDVGAETPVRFQVAVSDGLVSVTQEVDVRVTVPTYAQVQQVWDSVCTTCHNASSASGGLNLAAGSSYDALVDVPGTSPDCASSSYDRVTPGLPNASLLVLKVSGTTCGARMPKSDPTYFDRFPGLLTRIRSWILAGASK